MKNGAATRIILLSLLIVASHSALCQSKASQAPSEAESEPRGPSPSVAVQKALDSAAALKQPDQVLTAVADLIGLSTRNSDQEGLALSHSLQAKTLQSSGQPEQAADAWHQAAEAFEKVGDAPGQIEALAEEGVLRFKKDQVKANECFRKAQSLGREEKLRPIGVSRALNNAGSTVWDIRQAQPARDFFNTALEKEEQFEPESLDLAKSCEGLGTIAFGGGVDLKLAEQYWTRSLTIREKLAPGSELVATSLFRIGNLHARGGKPQAAKDYFERSLAIAEKIKPEPEWLLAADLNSLGIVAAQAGDYLSAENYLERALPIVHKSKPDSVDEALSFLNLGNIKKLEGDFGAADKDYRHAESIQENLSPDSSEHAGTLINLASLAELQADYVAAKSYLKQALSLQEKVVPGSLDMALTLHQIGKVASQENDLASAAEFFEKALAIKQKNVPPDSTEIADEFESLGELATRSGHYSVASEDEHKALAIYQKQQATGDTSGVQCLIALGDLEYRQEHYGAGEGFYRAALDLQQKQASGSPDMAKPLQRLGDLYAAQANVESARNYYNQALAVLEKTTPESPDVARNLVSAARLLVRSDPERALEMSLRAEQVWRDHLRLTIRGLTERQSLLYASSRPNALDLSLTLVAGPLHDRPADRRRVMDALIRSRALILDEMASRHKSVVDSKDAETLALGDQVRAATQRLANLSVEGPQDMPFDAYRSLVDQAKKKKEELELSLSEKSVEFRGRQTQEQVGIEQVTAALPAKTALIAFVHYVRIDSQNPKNSARCYAAFIQRGTADPEFLFLGKAVEVEQMWSLWRKEVMRPAHAAGILSSSGEASYLRAGTTLRKTVWDPLKANIGDATRFFVVPDGVLNLLNLNSLPTSGDRYLVESGPTLAYLSAERDLTIRRSAHGTGIVVVGNPDFNRAAVREVAANKTNSSATEMAPMQATRQFRGSRSGCRTFADLHFGPLPASKREAEDVLSLWKQSKFGGIGQIQVQKAANDGALEFTGTNATRAAFSEQAPGKLVLHLATHSFFFDETCSSGPERLNDVGSDRSQTFVTAGNPLLLSGLAFAGANQHSENQGDGVLSAEEIAGMNLKGVDWAVLSGCDTGAGTVKSGEGVFGLRRAFQIAGVNTVIMSLWPIEDEATRQWMSSLYREHFLNGKDSAESVRAASLATLRRRRANHESTHPFFWGAFVASGGS